MSLSLHRYDRRARGGFWRGLARMLVVLALLAGAAAAAYRLGVEHEARDTEGLLDYVAELEASGTGLRAENIRLAAEAQTARARQDELTRRLDSIEVPDARYKPFYDLVAGRLEAGVDPDRLAFYINAAGEPRNCRRPGNGTFVLPTAPGQPGETSASLAGITVSGMGVNARGADGTLFSWFDPTQRVTIDFRREDGQESSVTGVLPLRHSVVLDDTEHRFTITAGERGSVDVQTDECDFP